MSRPPNETFRIENEIAIWEDQGAIMLKLMDRAGDPIELNESSARKLAMSLIVLADKIKADDEK